MLGSQIGGRCFVSSRNGAAPYGKAPPFDRGSRLTVARPDIQPPHPGIITRGRPDGLTVMSTEFCHTIKSAELRQPWT